MKKIFLIIVLFSLSLNAMAQSRARPDRSMDAIILYGMGLSRLDEESVRSTYRMYGYEREGWSEVGFRLVRNAD